MVRDLTDKEVYVKQSAVFEVELNKPNVSVQWLYRKVPLENCWKSKIESEGKIRRMTVADCTLTDSGQIAIFASTLAYDHHTNANLIVRGTYKPKWLPKISALVSYLCSVNTFLHSARMQWSTYPLR